MDYSPLPGGGYGQLTALGFGRRTQWRVIGGLWLLGIALLSGKFAKQLTLPGGQAIGDCYLDMHD